MLDLTLALVGAGPLPELSMREGSQYIADRFSAELIALACGEEPQNALREIASRQRDQNSVPTLLRLCGDAAMVQGSGSWLDALAAWRCPALLLVQPNSAGFIPGVAPASVALCYSLGIPLVGLVQLGGVWNPSARRMDGLPWCGRIGNGNGGEVDQEAVLQSLKQRWKQFDPALK